MTMKQTITILVLIFVGAIAYAKDIEWKSKYDSIDVYHVYSLRISEVGLDSIYGQLIPNQQGKTYGGDLEKNKDYFRANYAWKYNQKLKTKGLFIDRGEDNDIIFYYKCDTIDTIDIEVYAAMKGQKGWGLDSTKCHIIKWTVGDGWKKETPSLQLSDDNAEQRRSLSQSVNWIDWVLIGLILVLSIALFVVVRRHKNSRQNDNVANSPNDNFNKESFATHDAIKTLQKQFIQLCNNLSCQLTALSGDVQGIRKTLDENKTVTTASASSQQAHTDSCQNVPHQNKETNIECVIGDAGFDQDSKTLTTEVAIGRFFRISKIKQSYLFTLIDSPDVKRVFETQGDMLSMYKGFGLIRFDNLPNNSTVSIVEQGELRPISKNQFAVVKPLHLKFE